MTPSKVEYVGKDLEAMDFALRYHSWILDLIKPYLGKKIVEVGAGTGSFSKLLLQTGPESLTLIEPSKMFETLSRELSAGDGVADMNLIQDLFSNAACDIAAHDPPDSLVYVNVLEHIEDDAKELRIAHQTLVPGGRLILFVPALPFLFSQFDRFIGHYRRYRRSELKAKCEEAGFRVVMIRWFDLVGVIPWFVKFRLFGSTSVEPGAVRLYDRLVVPLTRPVENLVHPPVGKNLLLIAEKTDGPSS